MVSHHFSFQDSGFRIQETGFRIQDSGDRGQDSGDRRQGTGFRRLFFIYSPHFPTPHTPHPTFLYLLNRI
ncbi:MAG: hypothetical protein EWV41_16035 [Microcystis wesenbergii Mw_MB_S_20031200_S109]|uniref:Uncharacterized protein n=1 Tax=Microcystis wesenbergii Mw_MB_S_20031200_S109D TaxID=2486241 RepID=A0A552LSG1_9CHRO|nr:MAG: hypothetical protein EWV41_16035 [Microcystis wesenbergii Mw_MB_S_20031200_S109]TRV23134.1 MAG: hypothetical protein EWV88_12245 [Microcystis wesenbergii Mw_MB_S_20031200_S109D]